MRNPARAHLADLRINGGARLALAAALALCAAAPATAAAAFKPVFDPTGRVINGFDLRVVAPNQKVGGLVVESNGNTVAAGLSGSTGVLTFARYTPAGTLDRSFGHAGLLTVSTPPLVAVSALLRRPDGRLVAVAASDFAPTRSVTLVGITAAGAIDRSFGTRGVFTVPYFDFASPDNDSSALDASGAVLLGGAHDGRPAVTRVTAGGALDESFGAHGIAEVPGLSALTTVAADPGGDVFALGVATDALHDLLFRLSPTGVPRTTYGTGGVVTTAIDTSADVLALGAGRVLLLETDYPHRTIRRYLTDGSLDPTYGQAGIAQFRIDGSTDAANGATGSGQNEANGLQPPSHGVADVEAIEDSPRLLRGPGGGVDVVDVGAIARLGAGGALTRPVIQPPPGFGGGSFESTQTFGNVRLSLPAERPEGWFDVTGVAERPDGGLLLGGGTALVTFNGADSYYSDTWALLSLRPDLSPDPSFGTPAKVRARLRMRPASTSFAAKIKGGIRVTAWLADRGDIVMRVTARRHGRTIVVADRTALFVAAGSAKIRVKVTPAGARLLRHVRRQRVTIHGQVTLVGGEVRTLRPTSLTLH